MERCVFFVCVYLFVRSFWAQSTSLCCEISVWAHCRVLGRRAVFQSWSSVCAEGVRECSSHPVNLDTDIIAFPPSPNFSRQDLKNVHLSGEGTLLFLKGKGGLVDLILIIFPVTKQALKMKAFLSVFLSLVVLCCSCGKLLFLRQIISLRLPFVAFCLFFFVEIYWQILRFYAVITCIRRVDLW